MGSRLLENNVLICDMLILQQKPQFLFYKYVFFKLSLVFRLSEVGLYIYGSCKVINVFVCSLCVLSASQ